MSAARDAARLVGSGSLEKDRSCDGEMISLLWRFLGTKRRCKVNYSFMVFGNYLLINHMHLYLVPARRQAGGDSRTPSTRTAGFGEGLGPKCRRSSSVER